MDLEFDHVFILTQPEGSEADAVIASGFTEGSRNIHPGQGTANRRVFFHNAMLEFLWVTDAAETHTDLIAPMQFLARANYRQSNYSPFGIGLRHSPGTKDAEKLLPFETWAFRPPYLPSYLQFEVAYTQRCEPLIFVMPFRATRPDAVSPDKRQPLEHSNAVREITELCITLPQTEPLSPALHFLQELGIAFAPGQTHRLEITFDGGSQGRTIDFQPKLPLVLQG